MAITPSNLKQLGWKETITKNGKDYAYDGEIVRFEIINGVITATTGELKGTRTFGDLQKEIIISLNEKGLKDLR